MSAIANIIARPIAHRGYHSKADGIIENSPSAISAAIAKGFGIEVDVQETADGEALVFHDYTLERLTNSEGRVINMTAAELTGISMKDSADKLWLLNDLFALVKGQVPLVIEIKSRHTTDAQADFVRHVVDQVAAYQGPVCIKTFDPDMLSIAREHNPEVLRGIVADDAKNAADYARFSRMERFIFRHMLHIPRTRPHFISYGVNVLDAIGPSIWRNLFRIPVMTWTVRTPEQRAMAKRYADQMVFEGFDPDAS
ncbi:MAG: glycerophosphodiester phosphodiesterase [Rhodobacteraceae bacterium]|nr:glycerophosphodiester phosphodiesterase [Paracoccaceae bacterium]